jgi:hypothetical protein
MELFTRTYLVEAVLQTMSHPSQWSTLNIGNQPHVGKDREEWRQPYRQDFFVPMQGSTRVAKKEIDIALVNANGDVVYLALKLTLIRRLKLWLRRNGFDVNFV